MTLAHSEPGRGYGGFGMFPDAARPRLAAQSGTISLHGLPAANWASAARPRPWWSAARGVCRIVLLLAVGALVVAAPAAALLYAARQLSAPLRAVQQQQIPGRTDTPRLVEMPAAHTVALLPAHH